jgi:hypothetical protein
MEEAKSIAVRTRDHLGDGGKRFKPLAAILQTIRQNANFERAAPCTSE